MTSTTITVTGMTCGHCEAAVKEELGGLPGVSEVAVELNPGGDSPVTITSADELDGAAIRAAVDEAGYEVSSHEVK
ncbi:MAG: heavy-metal-associated domain-containing protein [Brevibacterium sp.]